MVSFRSHRAFLIHMVSIDISDSSNAICLVKSIGVDSVMRSSFAFVSRMRHDLKLIDISIPQKDERPHGSEASSE